jgi:ABC-type maltose transport system permease subunit
MAQILEFNQFVKAPLMVLWRVDEFITGGQLSGYKVVRFNVETQKEETLDVFLVDMYDNNQTKFAEAWNAAATLMSRANRDVLGV